MRCSRTGSRRAAACLLLLLAAGCGNAGAPDPATREGDDAIRLWIVLLLIAIAIGVVVLGLFAYAAIRWRDRGQDEQHDPPQTRANLRLEILYSLIPLVIVAAVFTYSTVVQVRAEDDSRADFDVEVTAFRWGWRFDYPGENVTVVGNAPEKPVLVLPVDAVVRFRLDATDVIHSIWVPEFFTKRDLIPGERNTFTVETTRTGVFTGYCAEYCGLDHARMLFDVSVVTGDDYDDWLVANREPQP